MQFESRIRHSDRKKKKLAAPDAFNHKLDVTGMVSAFSVLHGSRTDVRQRCHIQYSSEAFKPPVVHPQIHSFDRIRDVLACGKLV